MDELSSEIEHVKAKIIQIDKNQTEYLSQHETSLMSMFNANAEKIKQLDSALRRSAAEAASEILIQLTSKRSRLIRNKNLTLMNGEKYYEFPVYGTLKKIKIYSAKENSLQITIRLDDRVILYCWGPFPKVFK